MGRYPRKSISVKSIVAISLMFGLGSPVHAWQPQNGAYPYPYPQPYSRPVYQAPRYYPPPAAYYPAARPRYQTTPWYYAYPPAYPSAPTQVPVKPDSRQAQKAPVKTQDGDIQAMKKAFVEGLLPHVRSTNRKLQSQRQKLLALANSLSRGQVVTPNNQQWLKRLIKKYRLKLESGFDQNAMQELLKRVDIIPPSLALAQAANESAWGRSRFATEANNLFGIWTYNQDKGLIPEKRDATQTHLVRKFDDHAEAVEYYMHMLNTHPAYQPLREIRARLRSQNRIPEGHLLAEGLEDYSAKGEEYISLIQQLIRQNQWAGLDETYARSG